MNLVSLSLVTAFSFACGGQNDQPLSVEDNLSIHSFAEYTPISFSPDAKLLAYAVRSSRENYRFEPGNYERTGIEWYSVGGDVRIVDTATKKSKSITTSKGNNSLPSWSPDSKFLAFISDRDGDGQAELWVWNRQRDQIKRVSPTPVRCDQIEWTPDSHQILTTTLPIEFSPIEYVRKASPEAAKTGSTEHNRIDASVTTFHSEPNHRAGREGTVSNSEPWNLNRYLRDLVIIEPNTGGLRPVVQGERISRFQLSPDGSRVAYTTPTRFERAGSQQILYDLKEVDIKGHRTQILARDIRLDYDGGGFSWSSDGSSVSFLTGGPGAVSSGLYVVAVNQVVPQAARLVYTSPEVPPHYSPALWDGEGALLLISGRAAIRVSAASGAVLDRIQMEGWSIRQIIAQPSHRLWLDPVERIAVVARNERSEDEGIFLVDLKTGTTRSLLSGAECLACANPYLASGITAIGHKIAYLREDSAHPSDLWILEAETAATTQLTDLNPQLHKYRMGASRLVSWLGIDGQHLQGVLLLPSDYEVGKQYPLVAFVYAGAFPSRFLNRFGVAETGPLNPQLLATRGYVVLFPDSPQRIGDPMSEVLKTIMPGVNRVVETGIADSRRLGVMGFSNGGYTTLALIVQTQQFRAAVEIEGTADLMAAYGEMNKAGAAYATGLFEHGQDGVGGSPWDVRDRYIENSPIYYLDRITTPLLMVHGDADSYIAPFLADELFVGMRRLGKVVEYSRYGSEGHDPVSWSYSHQLDLSHQVLGWFAQHLGNAPLSPGL